MRFLVFPCGSSTTLMGCLKNSLKINVDLADNVVIRETQKKARLYTESGWEEYEITNIIEMGKDTFYIAGRLLKQAKRDYARPVKNEEVLK